MKILLITDNHTPTGGAEKYFFELKSKLKSINEISVYSLGFGPHTESGKDYIIFKGIKSKLAKLFWQLVFNPWLYFKLSRAIKTINPDVIHLHNNKHYSPTLLEAIKNYPVVQTMHDFSYICPLAQNIHQDNQVCDTGLRNQCFWQHQVKYSRLIYLGLSYSFFSIRKKAHQIIKRAIAPSPILVSYLQKNGFTNAQYLPHFKPVLKSLSFDAMKATHFLFAGNLGNHKGVYLLLDEFARACKENHDLILNIAGTGSEEKGMRNRVNELGIKQNVRFLGWQDNLEIYIRECCALLFTSTGMEAFGLIITEAMSYGRAVIGVDRGTSAWLIDDKQTGLLFDPLKPGNLAEKILLIANDNGYAKSLGRNAFQKITAMPENDTTLADLIAIYKNIATTSNCQSHQCNSKKQ